MDSSQFKPGSILINTETNKLYGVLVSSLPNNKIIMLESKNYINTVNKDEIIKLQNDMINHHIKWGLFLSFNSKIQGMKEIDFEIFNHNNENYHIIFVSNLSNDISKLDFSLSLIRKLLNTYSSCFSLSHLPT